MRRIKILRKGLSDADTAAVAALAASAGCSDEEIEVVPTIGEPVPDCDDEILLVVMSPAMCSDPSLEEELSKAQRGGRRAICIWPEKGETLSEPPSAAKKYAYSIIRWEADKLHAAVADDDVLFFETPSGEPLPKVETERNLCVPDDDDNDAEEK